MTSFISFSTLLHLVQNDPVSFLTLILNLGVYGCVLSMIKD